MRKALRSLFVTAAIVAFSSQVILGEDWSAYRADNARSATTAEKLQFPLSLAWKYVPAQKHRPAWPDVFSILRRAKAFDYAPQPVIAGGLVYFGSTTDNTLWALDGATGKTKWAFTTGAPVRFAPAIAGGKAYVGSDDGFVYCLDAADGKLLWKFRGGLDDRKVMGNGRMISRWPIRSGVGVADGAVYFAAGMWSAEGVYVFALDARTGKEIWCNDTNIELTVRPHSSAAMLGNMPQGYLAIDKDKVGFYNSVKGVYWYNTKTGLPAGQTRVGDPRKIDFMELIVRSSKDPEPVPTASALVGGVAIECKGNKVTAGSWTREIGGTAFGIAAGNGMLVVTSTDGVIYCFKSGAGKTALVGSGPTPKVRPPLAGGSASKALRELAKQKITKGYALILGDPDAKRAEAIAARTQLNVICALSDPARVAAERKRLRDTTGLYGRVTVDHLENPKRLGYPRYFANLILADRMLEGVPADEIKRLQRPCGGILVAGGKVTLRGKLPGAYDWDSKVTSDQLVRGPMELLWFGEPGPSLMNSKVDKPMPANGRVFFVGGSNLVVADAYNGTILWQRIITRKEGRELYADDHFVRIGSQTFDAQTGKTATRQTVKKGNKLHEPRRSDEDIKKYLAPRIHPLTGGRTSKFYSQSHGCGGGRRAPKPSATMDFFRSSTLGWYDYEDDSGMRNWGGLRGGCQFASMTPSQGIVLATEGQGAPGGSATCGKCFYVYNCSLGLVPAARRRGEDWATFGDRRSQMAGAIRHASLNFGAPGDRRDDTKSLWLAAPRPYHAKEADRLAIPLSYSVGFYGDVRHYRRNADRLPITGTDKPWVYTSGYRGLKRVSLDLDYHDDKTRLLSAATATAPTIDGSLNDPCWTGEGEVFRHFLPKSFWSAKNDLRNMVRSYYHKTLKTPPQVAYIRHDAGHLYFGYRKRVVVGRRGKTVPIKAKTRGADAPVWQDDAFSVFITDNAGGKVLHFGVSASGATYDSLTKGPFPTGPGAGRPVKRPKGVPPKPVEDISWNGDWSSGVKVEKGKVFSAEIAIPWKTLERAGLKKGDLHASLARNQPLETVADFLRYGDKLYVSDLKPVARPYTVRLHFAELENDRAGQRVFDVKLSGKTVLKDFDIFAAAGGKNRAVIKEFKGILAAQSLLLELVAKTQPPNDQSTPIISGMQVIAEKPGPVPPPVFGKLTKRGNY
jgi:outer membrane protein assembly factor BamB